MMEMFVMYLATQAQFFSAHQAREVEALLAEFRRTLKEIWFECCTEDERKRLEGKGFLKFSAVPSDLKRAEREVLKCRKAFEDAQAREAKASGERAEAHGLLLKAPAYSKTIRSSLGKGT